MTFVHDEITALHERFSTINRPESIIEKDTFVIIIYSVQVEHLGKLIAIWLYENQNIIYHHHNHLPQLYIHIQRHQHRPKNINSNQTNKPSLEQHILLSQTFHTL